MEKITWEQFEAVNENKTSSFENMCRLLFNRQFLDNKKNLISKPNHPGVEVYPVFEEKSGKWRCLVRGLCFVSEEAIPYMINDKRGIHLPCIIASGIAGALSMFFGCSQMFPHGGIATLPFINHPHFFIISIFASALIGMSFVLFFKKSANNY